MTPRDTRTGHVLERMILPSLQQGGYACETQKTVGNRIGGGRHKVDAIATKAGRNLLVSLKWQQVGGTAEQKVPFEVICLMKAVRDSSGTYEKAYLVLGGRGWKLRDAFVKGELKRYIPYQGLVEIVALEDFVALANGGKL
ncbi:MAG TPA: PD-(D/E)XK nuclease superfamily protein [Terriglobales bacterium]|nr:PD-(D/E)XK nuclease superfamily protein [Terriglobales bacterium]